MIWLFLRVLETVDAHSGYYFPWSPFNWLAYGGSERHDFHHSHGTGNYGGAFVPWDALMGTDKAYLKWKANQNENGGQTKTE